MIVFCEDCGQKNSLDVSDIDNGKAVFQCTVCGYPNAFGLTPHDLLFYGFSRYPDIMGGFIFHSKKGILRAQMPDILQPRDIELLGDRLVQAYKFGAAAWPDIHGMTARVSDKYLFVQKISSSSYAVIAGINPELPQEIGTLIDQLVPDIG